jgi:hypothetical protein
LKGKPSVLGNTVKQTGFSTSINVQTIRLCESNKRFNCYSESSELLRTEFQNRFQVAKIHKTKCWMVACTTQFWGWWDGWRCASITVRINFVFLFEILNLPALRAKDYSYITANLVIFFSRYLCENITYKMKMFKETKINS